jgi:hypothetical protein
MYASATANNLNLQGRDYLLSNLNARADRGPGGSFDDGEFDDDDDDDDGAQRAA